jgi:hypothetical protein
MLELTSSLKDDPVISATLKHIWKKYRPVAFFQQAVVELVWRPSSKQVRWNNEIA